MQMCGPKGSRLVLAQVTQCGSNKGFGAGAQGGLEQRGEVRAVVRDVLFLFAAGKYPEAVGNAEGAGNGGKILGGGEGLGVKDAVGAKIGRKRLLKALRGVLIVAGKRVGIVVAELGRLRAAGGLALGSDDALDGAGDFSAR